LFFYARIKEGVQFPCPLPILTNKQTQTQIKMHLLLEDFIEQKENEEGKKIARPSLPSISDANRKAYYGRRKLTLQEKWAIIWRNKCYPLV
jgi:hypothetical protein